MTNLSDRLFTFRQKINSNESVEAYFIMSPEISTKFI